MIRECTFLEIEPFKKLANKEGIHISKDFSYIGYFDDKLLGFVAYTIDKNKATFRNDFVFPEYRHKGIYRDLNNFRLNLMKTKGIKNVEVNCKPTSLPLHLKCGGKITRTFIHTTRVIYENI